MKFPKRNNNNHESNNTNLYAMRYLNSDNEFNISFFDKFVKYLHNE